VSYPKARWGGNGLFSGVLNWFGRDSVVLVLCKFVCMPKPGWFQGSTGVKDVAILAVASARALRMRGTLGVALDESSAVRRVSVVAGQGQEESVGSARDLSHILFRGTQVGPRCPVCCPTLSSAWPSGPGRQPTPGRGLPVQSNPDTARASRKVLSFTAKRTRSLVIGLQHRSPTQIVGRCHPAEGQGGCLEGQHSHAHARNDGSSSSQTGGQFLPEACLLRTA
jgi:hypothetical protein